MNEGLQVSSLTLMSLPITLRIMIFNHLGETNDELIYLTLVSKGLYEDCKRPGIEWKLIPTIEISAVHGSTQKLIQNVSHNQKNKKLDRYSHMRINDVHKFDYISLNEIDKITKDVRLEGIISLDLSIPYQSTARYIGKYLLYALLKILPKLLELDLSNNSSLTFTTLYKYSKDFRFLEKITCQNITKDFNISLSGIDMRLSDHLKEIYMDSSVFLCNNDRQKKDFSDLNNPTLNKYFIFHYCCKSLERVSIRNAKLYKYDSSPKIIPQNALIKFVRNAPPSLRWFRSDLTHANMDMLQLERPDIELLN
jgi:hypothetical protein